MWLRNNGGKNKTFYHRGLGNGGLRVPLETMRPHCRIFSYFLGGFTLNTFQNCRTPKSWSIDSIESRHPQVILRLLSVKPVHPAGFKRPSLLAVSAVPSILLPGWELGWDSSVLLTADGFNTKSAEVMPPNGVHEAGTDRVRKPFRDFRSLV